MRVTLHTIPCVWTSGNVSDESINVSLLIRDSSYVYMSAHALLNLLNELGKRDKMRGYILLCKS